MSTDSIASIGPFDGPPKVIVTTRLPLEIEQRLSDLFDADLRRTQDSMTVAELKQAVQNCDVLVPTVTDLITAEIIAAASPKLKMIASFGAGTDHIDAVSYTHLTLPTKA